MESFVRKTEGKRNGTETKGRETNEENGIERKGRETEWKRMRKTERKRNGIE